jgi:hypothetical protein
METFDLKRTEDRLAVAARVFVYPLSPQARKHGPAGYKTYESYRDWLRDDFSYRCVFSLMREAWPQTQFHIDHFVSQHDRPDLECEYTNLILLEGRLNLVKGKKRVPDPGKIALGECLHVQTEGECAGEIEPQNETGEWLVRVLRLDSNDATRTRRQWLGILRSVAQSDEALFCELVGYPKNLPDLGATQAPENFKPAAVALCAARRRIDRSLPEWY